MRLPLLPILLILGLTTLLAGQDVCQWAVECGGMGCNQPTGIDTDIWGNIYVTGFFEDTATFGPYTLTATTSVAGGANRDIFVAKISPEGQWLWVARSVGTHNNVPQGLVTDDLGNSYVTGFYQGTVSFGDHFLTKFAPGNYIDGDMFLAKLDTWGNWLWAEAVGSPYFERPYDIDLDADCNIYVGGFFSGATTFGDIYITGESSSGYFIAKVSNGGVWQWVRYGGGLGEDETYSLAVDGNNNVFAAGAYEFTTQFGDWTFPGVANYNDGWFAKLDTYGTWLWARAYSSPGNESCGNVLADASGNCYISTAVDDSLTVDGVTYTPLGRSLSLFIKHDPDGNVLSVSQCGSQQGAYNLIMPLDVATDGINLFSFGQFSGPMFWGDIELTTPVGESGYNISNKYIALLSVESGEWVHVYQYHVKDPITSSVTCMDGYGGLLVATSFSEYADFGDFHFTSPDGIDNIAIVKFNAVVSVADEVAPVPSFKVSAYPNPFSGQVRIEVKDAVADTGTVTVYDLKGRKVRTLAAERTGNRTADFRWDSRDYSGRQCGSGVYLVRVSGNGGTRYKKVILLR